MNAPEILFDLRGGDWTRHFQADWIAGPVLIALFCAMVAVRYVWLRRRATAADVSSAAEVARRPLITVPAITVGLLALIVSAVAVRNYVATRGERDAVLRYVGGRLHRVHEGCPQRFVVAYTRDGAYWRYSVGFDLGLRHFAFDDRTGLAGFHVREGELAPTDRLRIETVAGRLLAVRRLGRRVCPADLTAPIPARPAPPAPGGLVPTLRELP